MAVLIKSPLHIILFMKQLSWLKSVKHYDQN